MRKIKYSKIDQSCNLLSAFGSGLLESRIVVRDDTTNKIKKICLYVSSHSGCIMGCGQCHLTANNERSFKPAHPNDYAFQISELLGVLTRSPFYANLQNDPKNLRFNIEFMARGEPLMNPLLTQNWENITTRFKNIFLGYGFSLEPSYFVSFFDPVFILFSHAQWILKRKAIY